MALPDFLIIGAMKSGTSTLHKQIEAQPGVFMTTPKEPNFFSDEDVYAKGLAWYESLFDGAAEGDLKGEASTHYTKLPTHPKTLERMAKVLTAPKLIYLIRDPMERAVSHYLHEWTEGVMGSDPIAEFANHPEISAYSQYAMQIGPYVEQFGRDAILVLRTEDLKSDPQGTLSRVGAHLGRDDFVWDDTIGAQNVSAERMRLLPFHSILVDSRVAQILRRSLVPKRLRTMIREARAPKSRPELPDDLRAKLQTEFDADRARLIEMFPDLGDSRS